MARIVNLYANDRPSNRDRYVLVLGNSRPPARTMGFSDHWLGRTYFASGHAASLDATVRKATVWADSEHIAIVYVQSGPWPGAFPKPYIR